MGGREGLGLTLCGARRVQRQRGRRAPRTQEPPASPLPAKALAAVRLEREASWLPRFLPWSLKAQDPSQEKEQELPSPQEKPPRVPRGGRQRPSSRSAGRQQVLLVDSAKAVPLEGVGSGSTKPPQLRSDPNPCLSPLPLSSNTYAGKGHKNGESWQSPAAPTPITPAPETGPGGEGGGTIHTHTKPAPPRSGTGSLSAPSPRPTGGQHAQTLHGREDH